MSLAFIDDEDAIADLVTAATAVVVAPEPADDPALSKRALLATIGRALLFADVFHDDNFDSFFDCLTETRGTVVLQNAALWWRREPALLGRVCQCFLDVADGRTLVCFVA